MLRIPKLDEVSTEIVPTNALKSNGSGTWLYPSDYITSNPGYYRLEEYMDDNPKGRSFWNSCYHLKRTRKLINARLSNYHVWSDPSHTVYWNFDVKPMASNYGWYGFFADTGASPSPANTYGVMFEPTTGLKPIGTRNSNGDLVPPVVDGVDNLYSRSISAMLPGLRPVSNVSLINSILELKDFASLPRSLRSLKTTASSISSWTIKWLTGKKLGSFPLRRLLRTSADAYLQAEFNILPLLSDIAAIQTAIKTVRNQLRQLVAHANTPQKRYYTVPLRDQYVDSYQTGQYDAIGFDQVLRYLRYGRSCTYRIAKFNAVMEYSYSLPSWVTEDSLMAALLDLVGVNLNPRIIWNAIPWSFVVDWVANVNSWLDNWRIRNIEPIVNIRGYCYTIHIQRIVTTSVGWGAAVPCVELVDDSYQRVVPERSALYSSLVTSGLSSKEFSLAAALAITR